jgi:Nucleotidyl transferase AbiEii toxin, Type IV TA system
MNLYYNTVSEKMKEVLLQLMQIPELSNFRLVGGTSLSLQLGHRKSVDIDLFTDKNADFNAISEALRNNFKDLSEYRIMNTEYRMSKSLRINELQTF